MSHERSGVEPWTVQLFNEYRDTIVKKILKGESSIKPAINQEQSQSLAPQPQQHTPTQSSSRNY